MPEQCFLEKMQPSEDMTFTSDMAGPIDKQAFLRLLLICIDSKKHGKILTFQKFALIQTQTETQMEICKQYANLAQVTTIESFYRPTAAFTRI